MPALHDILSGFESVRPEGSAFIVEASASTRFKLIDLERAVSLHRAADAGATQVTVWGAAGTAAPSRAQFILWQRKDGSFGAIAPLSVDGGEITIETAAEGLMLVLHGDEAGQRPAAAFAVASDPYVAADFCRAATSKATGNAVASPYAFIDATKGDPADAIYEAAVRSIWSRPLRLAGETSVVASASLLEAAKSLFNIAAPIVTRDRLFVDCRTEPRLLKVFTHKGRDGVLGIFHCQSQDVAGPITDTWRVDDVEGLGGSQVAAWHAVERKLFIIDRGVDEAITLPRRGAEIIHLVPILQNVAPLGLLDRLNASAVMSRVGSRKCQLSDGGQVGWYAATRPSRVTLDGQPVAFQYEQANGLVTFDAERGRPHESEVTL